MSTRMALTVVGTVVGAYFGYPQLGAMAGALIGSAVDPTEIQGPTINEGAAQTVAEGIPRTVIFGRWKVGGNIIQRGALEIVETSESQGKGSTKVKGQKAYRTYAIGICKGGANVVLLKVWKDNKLVYDMSAGSAMVPQSEAWIANKRFYNGSETQLPDPDLEAIDADTPAYAGSAYMAFLRDDLSDMNGAISQYEFELATSATASLGALTIGPTNGGKVVDVNADADGNMIVLLDQTGGGVNPFTVGDPGTFTLSTRNKADINIEVSSVVITNGGDPVGGPSFDQRNGIIAIGNQTVPTNRTLAGGSLGSNNTATRVLMNGATSSYLVNEGGAANWDTDDAGNGTPPLLGGSVFFYDDDVFIARNRSSTNKLYKWTAVGGGNNVAPTAYVVDPFGASTPFMMTVSRQGNVRIMRTDGSAIREYDNDLIFTGTRTPPSLGASSISAFGFDEAKGWQAYLFIASSILTVSVFDLSGTLLQTYNLGSGISSGNVDGKFIFTDENIYIKRGTATFSIYAPATNNPDSIPMHEIVDWVHEKCDFPAGEWNSSQLTDEIRGFGLSSAGYTGADAIDSLRLRGNFDKSMRGTVMHYQKRGANSVKALSYLDLTSESDNVQREQANEAPYKLNVRYPNPDAGYASLKESTGSISPDRRTTGEVTLDVPIAMSADEAAQVADIAYATMLAEIAGTTVLPIMLDSGTDLAEADCIDYTDRQGRITRLRIEQNEFASWALKLTCKADLQSAYTSDVVALLPAPIPEVPPSSIPGETIMAVIDGPARIDSEDRLGVLVAVTGASPAWYGAEVQRSINAGASYSPVAQFDYAVVIGTLLEDVPAASKFFTDTTNSVRVQLYRGTQTLDSLTTSDFYNYGGVFALENADGSWEWMQYLDASDDGGDQYTLTTLHRGVANTGGSAHVPGARFVMIAGAQFVDVSSGLLGVDLTHRAVSYGETEDDTDNEETREFEGNSQREEAPVFLTLTRDMSDLIDGSWIPVHRFGNDINPVASQNFQGFRVTIDDGSISSTFDTTASSFTGFDASGMASPVSVTVGAINRITGVGDTTSESI